MGYCSNLELKIRGGKKFAVTIDWASNTGPNTLKVVEKIFDSVSFEEQGYNSALSVLNLSSKYGKNLLERACSIALSRVNTPRYGQLNPIIKSLEGK